MSHPEQDGSLELLKQVEASYEQTLANFQDVSRLLSGGYGIAKKDHVYVTWRKHQKQFRNIFDKLKINAADMTANLVYHDDNLPSSSNDKLTEREKRAVIDALREGIQRGKDSSEDVLKEFDGLSQLIEVFPSEVRVAFWRLLCLTVISWFSQSVLKILRLMGKGKSASRRQDSRSSTLSCMSTTSSHKLKVLDESIVQTTEPETQKSAARLPGISNRCDELVDEIHAICATWSRLWDDCDKMEKDLRVAMNLQPRQSPPVAADRLRRLNPSTRLIEALRAFSSGRSTAPSTT